MNDLRLGVVLFDRFTLRRFVHNAKLAWRVLWSRGQTAELTLGSITGEMTGLFIQEEPWRHRRNS